MRERLHRGFRSVPAWLRRALLLLRRRPRSLWEPPWAGAYRTRPALEPEPEPRVARPPSPKTETPLLGLISAAFVAAGVFIARGGRQPDDRLCGLSTVIFFGLCLYVFVEQMIQGTPVRSRSGGRRMLAALGVAGVALVYLGIAEATAPLGYRSAVALGGVFLAGVAAWATGRAWRARR
jgi:hypothetical protein